MSVPSQQFSLTGLTCGHCVNAVVEEVTAIDGVSDASVDLVVDGVSMLTIATSIHIPEHAIAAALDEAGDYALAGPNG